MKLISVEKDYSPIVIGIEKAIYMNESLPRKIFRKTFKYFLFITFDEIFMPLFFNNIQRFLCEENENKFWLAAIEPDPKSYFFTNFNFYGAVRFSVSDTADSYLAALHSYPESSPADALAHNSNILIISTYQNDWVIYGDRNADIAICAFVGREKMELFSSIYGSDLLENAKFAAEYAYNESEDISLKNIFYKNYK